MGWWWENVNIWRGAGLGTFEIIGTAIQKETPVLGKSLLIYLHNDYLQVLFEQGVVGLLCGLIAYGAALKKAYDRPWLFLSLVGGLVVFSTQSPLFIACFGIFIGVLIRKTFSTPANLFDQWREEDKKKAEDQKEFDRIAKKYLETGAGMGM